MKTTTTRRSPRPILVFLLLAGAAAAAVYYFFIRDAGDGGGARKLGGPAMVRIETDGACWSALLPNTSDQPEVTPEEAGCGSAELPLSEGAGRPVVVNKTNDVGTLTVVALVDGRETARQSTAEPFGSVTVTP